LEDDLDLLQAVRVIWGGKYTIAVVTAAAVMLTVLVAFFSYAPLYEASATIDTAPYDISRDDIGQRPEDYTTYLTNILRNAGVVDQVILQLGADPDIRVGSASLARVGNTHLIRITATGVEPHSVNDVVEQAGLAALELTRDHTSAWLLSEEKTLNEALVFFDQLINNLYGEEGLPTYITDGQGNVLDLDPAYRRLMQERGEFMVKLNTILFELEELAHGPSAEQLLTVRKAGSPVNPIRWPLLIAMAGLLGAALSAAAVLARHHLTAQRAGQKPV
jgi:PAS domain-containing protein